MLKNDGKLALKIKAKTKFINTEYELTTQWASYIKI